MEFMKYGNLRMDAHLGLRAIARWIRWPWGKEEKMWQAPEFVQFVQEKVDGYRKDTAKTYRNLYITGHSLGGYLTKV